MMRPTPPVITDLEARASLHAAFDQIALTIHMLCVRDRIGVTGKATPLYSALWTANVALNKELDLLEQQQSKVG